MLHAQNNPPASLVAAFAGPDNYRVANSVFNSVNQTLAALSLPGSFIQPGDRVVLKPNWVKEHDERFPGPDQWEHVVTHPSVIEAAARWAAAKMEATAPSRFATRRRLILPSPESENTAGWTT